MSANKILFSSFFRHFLIHRSLKAPHLRLIHDPEQANGSGRYSPLPKAAVHACAQRRIPSGSVLPSSFPPSVMDKRRQKISSIISIRAHSRFCNDSVCRKVSGEDKVSSLRLPMLPQYGIIRLYTGPACPCSCAGARPTERGCTIHVIRGYDANHPFFLLPHAGKAAARHPYLRHRLRGLPRCAQGGGQAVFPFQAGKDD